MKRFLLKYWWIFPVVNLVCLLLIIPSLNYDLWGLASAFIIVFILLMVIQGIILIFCLCEKEWWRAIGSVIGGVVCLILFSFVSFVCLIHASSQPDSFGKEHPIPENLEFSIPLKYKELNDCDTCELIIWNSFQGGLYEYSFYYPALPDGKVYLRCFEVTENIELSASRLRTASSVEVKNHTRFGVIAN